MGYDINVIHINIFKPITTTPLDSLMDFNNNILTTPLDIAREILETQQNTFKRKAFICEIIMDHTSHMISCALCKFP